MSKGHFQACAVHLFGAFFASGRCSRGCNLQVPNDYSGTMNLYNYDEVFGITNNNIIFCPSYSQVYRKELWHNKTSLKWTDFVGPLSWLYLHQSLYPRKTDNTQLWTVAFSSNVKWTILVWCCQSCQNCFDLALEILRRIIMQDTRGDVTAFMDYWTMRNTKLLVTCWWVLFYFQLWNNRRWIMFTYFQKIVLSENLLCHKNLPHTV